MRRLALRITLRGGNVEIEVESSVDSYLDIIAKAYKCVLVKKLQEAEQQAGKGFTPIERLFFIAAVFYLENWPREFPKDTWLECQPKLFLPPNELQKTAQVDFFLFCYEGDAKLAIELDGHEFHQKTKEQAARDNRKTQLIMEQGIQVVRFSGSEVFRDPFSCVKQAAKIFLKMNSGGD